MEYKINDQIDQDNNKNFDSNKAFQDAFDSNKAFENALQSNQIENVNPQDLSYEPPSMTESAIRGAAQGVSFGFADEAEAGLRSLKENRPYSEILNEVRQEYKEAEEENPLTSLAGNLVGGIVPGGALASGLSAVGKLKTISSAIKGATGLGTAAAEATGLASLARKAPKLTRVAQMAGKSAVTSVIPGAIAGAGTSEEEGKAQGALEGAVAGAVTGGVLGGVTQVGKQVAKVVSDIPFVADAMDAIKLGSKGKNVITQKAGEKFWGEAEKKAQVFAQENDDMLSATAKLKQIVLDSADRNKKTHKIDRDALADTIEGMAQKITFTDDISTQEKKNLLSMVSDIRNMGEKKLKPSEVNALRRHFQDLTPIATKAKSDQVKEIALTVTDLLTDYRKSVPKTYFDSALKKLEASKQFDAKTIKNLKKLNELKKGNLVENLDETMSALMKLRDEYDISLAAHSTAEDKKYSVERLINLMTSQGKGVASPSSAKAQRQLEPIEDLLTRAYGKQGTKLERLKQTGRDIEIFRKSQGMDQSGNLGGFAGLGRVATVGGGNIIGLGYNKVQKLLSFPSPVLKGFANQIRKDKSASDISKLLANSLDEMASITEEGKKRALMNKLLQTPAYRIELNKLLGTKKEE
jgi:hypothetical protein